MSDDLRQQRLLHLANAVLRIVGSPPGDEGTSTVPPEAIIPASASEHMLAVVLEKSIPILIAQGRRELAEQVRLILGE